TTPFRSHRNALQAGQYVQLGEPEIGDAVDSGRIAGDHRVEPAATTRPTRRGTELAARIAEEIAGFVVQLGGERAFAHAGRVRLENAGDAIDLRRRDSRSGAGAARGRR